MEFSRQYLNVLMWCCPSTPPIISTETLLFYSQMVEHIRWIAWNWPVKKELVHARCIVKTAIEGIKTKWILFGLFLQCGYHLNALTNIGLWALRFNGRWITSGPDRLTAFFRSDFSTLPALKPAWGPIDLFYCLPSWSNWIPSVAYNESLQCFFSPHECLFSSNARFFLNCKAQP